MTLHNTLTGSDLHEPKGVDSAASGKIYVADGVGSGSWKFPKSGWAFYDDNATEQTINTAGQKLLINGLGSNTNNSALPLGIRGQSELWDTTTSKITPIGVNDSYLIQVDLPITSRTSAQYVIAQLDIGGAATPTIPVITARIEVDRAAPFGQVVVFDAFVGNTFLTNGGQIFLTTDGGSIGVTAPAIKITRTHGEII